MRIVIWGLKKTYHTHRHIHQAFYKNAVRLGYETLWVEDDKKNQKHILPGDLIIFSEVYGKMVPEKFKSEDYNLPIRDDVKYCLHNCKEVLKEQININNYINLAVYQNKAEGADIKIDTARYFDAKTRTLYQPWGTDLLYTEFKKPVYNKNRFMFWIGSIWNNDQNQGNIKQINILKDVLIKHKLRFVQLRFIPDFLNTFFIRRSRTAPAIAGQYQVDINYLPCRMFKNISYGQLGITNVKKFSDILGPDYIIENDNSIETIIDKVLKLSPEEYKKIVKEQQEKIKNYTYKESIENIIKCLQL
jgi:hypothetical protein